MRLTVKAVPPYTMLLLRTRTGGEYLGGAWSSLLGLEMMAHCWVVMLCCSLATCLQLVLSSL